tara:strand:- start:866 stop:1165 length:300 start_codon:yes stop_codon:yes gene_type:complete
MVNNKGETMTQLLEQPTEQQIHEFKMERLRMSTLLIGLKMNIKSGMHLTSPRKMGGTCYTVIKRDYGLKGTKVSVYNQFRKMCIKIGNDRAKGKDYDLK